jgi:hypothetical protein
MIVNILGAYAYAVNKVAHDINFTSLISSTTDDSIISVFKREDPSTRGKIPLPNKIADVEIKFTPLDEGGLGFQTAEEVRRRSSVAPIASPRLLELKPLEVVEEDMVIKEVMARDQAPSHPSLDPKALEPSVTTLDDTDL